MLEREHVFADGLNNKAWFAEIEYKLTFRNWDVHVEKYYYEIKRSKQGSLWTGFVYSKRISLVFFLWYKLAKKYAKFYYYTNS